MGQQPSYDDCPSTVFTVRRKKSSKSIYVSLFMNYMNEKEHISDYLIIFRKS